MVNRKIALGLLVLAVAAGLGLGLNARSAMGVQGEITQPEQWVPLTHDYSIGLAGQGIPFREYRRSDGSIRYEKSGDAQRAFVVINDLATSRYYSLEDDVWKLHPLRPQPFGGKPFAKLSRSKVIQVSSTDPRVQVVSALGGHLTFFELGAGRSNTVILCPELNMLIVWGQFEQGMVRETVALQLGEPNVAFAPPDGTLVQLRSDPAGSGPVPELPSITHARRMQQSVAER